MSRLHMLSLFTGIGGFEVGAQRNGGIEVIAASEVDPYCCRFIHEKLNLENGGSVEHVGIARHQHPHAALIHEHDIVPVEHERYGQTSVTVDDFMEGILPFPDICVGGFPCQNLSAANLLDNSGIQGDKSGLVKEQLRIFDNLEIPYGVFENSPNLIKNGLKSILSRLNDMGYIVEWEVVAACAFGYPFYRHRCYIVCYRHETALASSGISAFDACRRRAILKPGDKFPKTTDDGNTRLDLINLAMVKEPRSIPMRSKRINGLGNAVVPDIPQALFATITDVEGITNYYQQPGTLFTGKEKKLTKTVDLIPDKEIPQRGVMINGDIWSGELDTTLNPSNRAFDGLYPALLSRDGNNNFTSKSRQTRPGTLGGMIGFLQAHGANEGGLHPNFAELLMGFDLHHTDLDH